MTNAEMMEAAFKFKIGDIVALKAQSFLKDRQREKVLKSGVQALLILGRNMEECYGGVQLHYNVRISAGGDGYTHDIATVRELFQFSEPELIPFPEIENKGE